MKVMLSVSQQLLPAAVAASVGSRGNNMSSSMIAQPAHLPVSVPASDDIMCLPPTSQTTLQCELHWWYMDQFIPRCCTQWGVIGL